MLPRDGLANWLLTVPLGTVAALADAIPADIETALAAADPVEDARIGIVVDESDLPLIDKAINGLAAIAQAAYPAWYRGTWCPDIGSSGLERAALASRLPAVAATVLGVAPVWLDRALALVLAGRAPVVGSLPREIGLRQLGLAINLGAVTIVVGAQASTAPVQTLFWLARQSGAAVVSLRPDGEAVGSDALPLTRLSPRETDETPDRPADRALPFAGPVQGRPHWASAAEQRLAETLARDAELGGLFAFNQPTRTVRGSIFRPDLVWGEGGLIVEIDGFADHTTRDAFRLDRQRDYEFLLSGFVVLRLTNAEVLDDTPLALAKIRDAVRFRRHNG